MQSTKPTRRRALAALAGAAVAAPAAAIAAADPDGELLRVYAEVCEAYRVRRAAYDAQHEAHERADADTPDDLPHELYRYLGWDDADGKPVRDVLQPDAIRAMWSGAEAENRIAAVMAHHKARSEALKAHGYKKKEDAAGEADDQFRDVLDQLAEVRARTVRGVLAKLQAAEGNDPLDGCEPDSAEVRLILGAIADLRAILSADGTAPTIPCDTTI